MDAAPPRPCATDCKYKVGAWGACSRSCGTGAKSRLLTVIRRPSGRGRQCPGASSGLLHRACATKPCPAPASKKLSHTQAPAPAPVSTAPVTASAKVAEVALKEAASAAPTGTGAALGVLLRIRGAVRIDGLPLGAEVLSCGAPPLPSVNPQVGHAAGARAVPSVQCSGMNGIAAMRARGAIIAALVVASGAGSCGDTVAGPGRGGVLGASPEGGGDPWKWQAVNMEVRLCFDAKSGREALVDARNAAALLRMDSFDRFVSAAMRRKGLALASNSELHITWASVAAGKGKPSALPARTRAASVSSALQGPGRAKVVAPTESEASSMWKAFKDSRLSLWAALGFVAVLPFSFVVCMQVCTPTSDDADATPKDDRFYAENRRGVMLQSIDRATGSSAQVQTQAQAQAAFSAEQEAIWGSRAMYGVNNNH